MSFTSSLQKTYTKPKKNLGALWKERLVQIRQEPTVNKLEHPTRIDKARSYGFKAKQGFFIARVKVTRGGKFRPHFMGGRKPVHARHRMIIKRNRRSIAEERASRVFTNAEVLGSYWLARDGLHEWFEVILADRNKVSTYKGYEWIKNTHGRAFRGLTSAGRKYRGLRHKGKGSEKTRPSLNANQGRGN